MTMLTHPRSEPASYLPERRKSANKTVDLAVLKRISLRVVGVLLAGGAVAGVIALKAAIFLSRINY